MTEHRLMASRSVATMKRHTTTPVAPQRAVSDPSDAGLPSAEVLRTYGICYIKASHADDL